MITDVYFEAGVISVMSNSDNELSGPAESSRSSELSAGTVNDERTTVCQTAVSVSEQSAKHDEG